MNPRSGLLQGGGTRGRGTRVADRTGTRASPHSFAHPDSHAAIRRLLVPARVFGPTSTSTAPPERPSKGQCSDSSTGGQSARAADRTGARASRIQQDYGVSWRPRACSGPQARALLRRRGRVKPRVVQRLEPPNAPDSRGQSSGLRWPTRRPRHLLQFFSALGPARIASTQNLEHEAGQGAGGAGGARWQGGSCTVGHAWFHRPGKSKDDGPRCRPARLLL